MSNSLKLPYANLNLVASNSGKVTGATDIKRHADSEQTLRAAKADGRVGGERCFRLRPVTDLSTGGTRSLAKGNYYGVTCAGTKDLALVKTRDAALKAYKANRKVGRCQILLMTPITGPATIA